MSCAQFLSLSADERRELAAFVDGYLLRSQPGAPLAYDAEYVGDVVEILQPCSAEPSASFWSEISEFFPA